MSFVERLDEVEWEQIGKQALVDYTGARRLMVEADKVAELAREIAEKLLQTLIDPEWGECRECGRSEGQIKAYGHMTDCIGHAAADYLKSLEGE
jgi:hypothetical protein